MRPSEIQRRRRIAILGTGIAALSIVVAFEQYRRQNARKKRRLKAILYRPFYWTLNQWNDDIIVSRLRFNREEIIEILPYLNLNSIEWSSQIAPSEEFAFSVLLARMAYPLRLKDMVEFFGRSEAYLSLVCTDVVDHLQRRFKDFLLWDYHRLNYRQLKSYAGVINTAGGGDIVWGYIDGTLQKVCRPGQDQRVFYSGHKHHHGFKFQGIITPDGLFSSFYGPIVGSRGDWFIFHESGLDSIIQSLQREEDRQLYVFGDPAYTGSNCTISGYRKPPGGQLTAEEKKFNRDMSSYRVSVEHGFGHIQRYWMKNSFHHTLRIGSTAVASYYLVAALLSNIMTCLRGNQISERFQCDPPRLSEYFAVFGRDNERNNDRSEV